MTEQAANTDSIEILGASQNNLKGIDVSIPLNSMTVITGVSGSGKSSLAFDTLYAEGQRRYVESMSAYARQFLERISKPAVREIQGISPAISIRQKNSTRNPRSTVGTVTEIYDFLRLLYARAGRVICRNCNSEVKKDTVDEVVSRMLDEYSAERIYITFPLRGSALDLTYDSGREKIPYSQLIENLLKQGFYRLLESSKHQELKVLQLPDQKPETAEELLTYSALVDRMIIRRDSRDRLTDSLELSFAEGNGVAELIILGNESDSPITLRFSERFECQACGIPYKSPEPSLFSFNNPYGACPTCHGFGSTTNLDRDLIIPDPEKTLLQGPIDPFTKPKYLKFQKKLLELAEREGMNLDIPYESLPRAFREKAWKGCSDFLGVKGFFEYLARKKYKMHVRIFIARYRGYSRCADCNGERLRSEAQDVVFGGKRIAEVTRMNIKAARRFFHQLDLDVTQEAVADELLHAIKDRLNFLLRVGLEYLTLDRITSTLSGGEMQRIHLAASLGSALSGTIYVLDEPSIGLHVRDQERLVDILKNLRDLGNTIVVVEHEPEIIRAADQVIDIGPGAGELGGHVTFSGDVPALLKDEKSLTAKYLRRDLKVPTPVFRRTQREDKLRLTGIRQHNLKNLTLEIPLGLLVCITGVSGSGKSTLVRDVIYAGIKKLKNDWKGPVGRFDSIDGWEHLSEVLMVDQTPIGRTPRSNPVTYLKAFDEIRKLFASLRDSRAQNLTPAHFSFNISGGRCEACQGSGTITIEMQFLADVEVQCEECRGTRFQKRILDIIYKGKNVDDVLNMTVREAISFFSTQTSLVRKLTVLQQVGLGYLRLGQSATTLSGGEAQRIKLATYLAKKTSGKPLFIFDEPTTGLHFDDISKLLKAFDRLITRGASVLVIEHNLDVIKSADWIIDLGPEGGDRGGEIVVEGTPEEIAAHPESYTGKFLTQEIQSPRDTTDGIKDIS